jgi:hypothetical protein
MGMPLYRVCSSILLFMCFSLSFLLSVSHDCLRRIPSVWFVSFCFSRFQISRDHPACLFICLFHFWAGVVDFGRSVAGWFWSFCAFPSSALGIWSFVTVDVFRFDRKGGAHSD